MPSSVWSTTSSLVFTVPKVAGGHPRIVIGLAVAAVLVASAMAAVRTSVSPPVHVAATPLSPRPPVETVEALPQLSARLGADPRFMGAVLVARGDRVLFRQVYGVADQRTGEGLTLTSRFRLASLSKQFTAVAILKLQDDGRLDIDDPVCRWIQPCPAAWVPIRLHHLLSHTSGIPDLMARPGWGSRRVTPASMETLTEDSKAFRLAFTPGSKIRYDNAGYNLAAAVVEQASGMPFATYLQTAFFDPLGMKDSGFGDGEDLVTGHADLPGGLTPQLQANVSILPGAGALYSTLDDMLVWQRALHHGHVLSRDGYARMIADHAPSATPDERGRPRRAWGYGLFVNSLGRQVIPAFEERQIYHTGSWSGFRNLVSLQPDADVTVIVLSNNFHQRDAVFLISQQAMAEALGRPFPEGLDR